MTVVLGLRIAAVALAVLATAPAHALRFAFEPASRFGAADDAFVMTLRGEIEEGDLARLKRFIAGHRAQWLDHGGVLVPVIDGGDVDEARLLGAFVAESLGEVRLPQAGSSRCVSACFFMLAQAVERTAVADTVALHRPHFRRAAIAAAAPAAARERYAGLLRALRAELVEWSVPHALIERMFATPSDAAAWLDEEELSRLGRYRPWFAEYALGRCGLDAYAVRHAAELRALGDEAGLAALSRVQAEAGRCIEALRRAERQRLLDAIDAAGG